MTVYLALPATAPPNLAARYRPVWAPAESEMTTSVRSRTPVPPEAR